MVIKLDDFKINCLAYIKEAKDDETEDTSTSPEDFTTDSKSDIEKFGDIGGSGDAPLTSPGAGEFDDIDGTGNADTTVQPDPLGTNPKTLKDKPKKKRAPIKGTKDSAAKALKAVS